jgi:UDP-glucose:(glucosyl)LPS alpha-1,2-glucosyltransferase
MERPRSIAVILPPREGFGEAASGAVGLLVHRLAGAAGAFRTIVFGGWRGASFPGIDYRPVPLPFGAHALPYALALAARLRALRPAIVEVHNRPHVARLLALLLPGTPISLFLHNDPLAMRPLRAAAARRAMAGRLAAIVTVSEYLRRRFLEGIAAEGTAPRLRVLANCIDLPTLPPLAPPEARPPRILFAGRVVADKGADSFVAACARALPGLPGWQAAMIGGDRFRHDAADTPFIRDLRPRAAAAGVAMEGYRPHAEVLACLANAAIAVVPSRWQEPFGLAALEAMACGAALVCAPRGGLPEVAGEAALYADPDDPAALAAAIVTLATDPARRAALARAGMERARLFDLPRAAAALDDLRREILRR